MTSQNAETRLAPSAAAETGCRWIGDLPAYFHESYDTVMFITGREQAALAGADNAGVLYVCSDWLLWQQLVAEGYHAAHYELGILESAVEPLDMSLYLIRSNDWVFTFDENPTLFHGISLGHLMTGEVYNCLISYNKFRLVLSGFQKRFSCRHVVYCDLRTDVNFLSADQRRNAARIIAEDLGLSFDDRASQGRESRAISEVVYANPPERLSRRIAGWVYDFSLETLTRAVAMFSGKRPKVMVLVNRNILSALLKDVDRATAALGFLSRTPPRSVENLAMFLRHAVRLFGNRKVRLTPSEKEAVAAIQDVLSTLPGKARTAEEKFVFGVVSELEPVAGRLTKAAEAVKTSERLFDRFKPDRIIVDGIKNTEPRAHVEVAHLRGINAEYTWHSPLCPQTNCMDALGGDPRQAPRVTRCLTWGPIHEKWLDAIQSDQPRAMTGSPIADRYAGPDDTNVAAARINHGQRENVLMLLYTPLVEDVLGLNANIYQSYVEGVSMLRANGIKNIRFKLHPGPGRWKKEYFEEIKRYMGLECDIMKMEPFQECVDWADAVIGPLVSGAMAEPLAAGKPFYPLLLRPHTLQPSFYGDFTIYESTADACEALISNVPVDGAPLLDALYNTDKASSNAQRFWAAASAPKTDNRTA